MSLRAQFRSLVRARGLTAAVIVPLAVGIGVLTATFGIVDAALFRQPPFREAERLTMVYMERTSARDGTRRERWSFPGTQALKRAAASFEGLANYTPATMTVSGDGDAESVTAELVSPSYFPVLGAAPLRGRGLVDAEYDPASPQPVVVLGHDLWARRFASDPGVVGRAVRLNGVPLTVVGVMPRGFRGVTDRAELWIPATMAPRLTYAEYLTTDQSFISVVGRLRPGVDLERARTELALVGARVAAEVPVEDREAGERFAGNAIPINEARADARTRRAMLILLAAVALLHLLACANVVNLLLGRAAARRREAAVRIALGSTPARLFRQFVVEGLALGVGAGALGLLLASWAADAPLPADAWAPRNFYGSLGTFDAPAFGWRTAAFGLALAAVTALLVAVVPAASVLRTDVTDGLRDGARGASGGGLTLRRPSARGAIVALETALAMLLLVASGLLIDSFARMRRADLGVDARNVLTFRVQPSEARIPPAQAAAFVSRVLDAVSRVPGVVAASVDGGAPLSGSARSTLHIAGRPVAPPDEPPPVLRHYVAPDHFRVLGIPLRRGRALAASDVAGSPRVVVISESAAKRFWPNEDPIGRRVWFGGGSDFDSPERSAEIVGVVGDVAYEPLDRRPNPSSFYTPYTQFTYAWRVVMLRTAGDPSAVVPAVRKAVHSVDPELALTEVRALADVIGASWARHRFDAALFALFGGAALLLAASGIYAVVAYAVGRRTREMGIRIALGAPHAAVMRLVIGEGMAWPLVGLVAGVAIAPALTVLLRASLYDVAPTEPRVFAAGVGILLSAAVVACLVPARRATRADPLEALRAE